MKYRILCQIWEDKSFTKAAIHLNMTQSAVSHAVNAFEKELGFPIFHRLKKGIQLTNEGEVLMPLFNKMVITEDHLYNEIHAINMVEAGTLRVGSFASASSRILPEIIKAYAARYPNISVELFDSDYDIIKAKLDEGSIDIAVLEETYLEPHYDYLSYLIDEMLVIMEKSEWIDENKSLNVGDIKKYPFIMPDNDQDMFLKTLLKTYDSTPNVKYKFQLMTTVFAMVEVGLGISIVPESALVKVDYEVAKVSLIPKLYRRICFASLKSQMNSPVVRGFYEVAQQSKMNRK